MEKKENCNNKLLHKKIIQNLHLIFQIFQIKNLKKIKKSKMYIILKEKDLKINKIYIN